MTVHASLLAAALLATGGLASAQTITTVAGNGVASYSGDGGSATQATINGAPYVATDLSGNLYIADQNNNRVRRVDANGIITTVAGTGAQGFSGDGGPAAQASLNYPTGVCTDAAGNLYINDLGNYRVRKVDTSGKITTVAGNGLQGSGGDGGPATQASMYIPIRCVVDASGNLYVTDQSGQKIRMINPAGVISTFAGTGANAGPHSIGTYSGDGGPAGNAALNNPTAITVDSAGNIYFSDQYNQRIRKVDKNGIITTIAGNGTAGYSGDNGPATAAALNYPGGLVADQNGDIYVIDDLNYRLRKISGGTIMTVAGNGVQGFAGDNGAAGGAEFNGEFGVALDVAGNVYIADSGNNRIRKISSVGAAVPPAISAASVTNGASFKSGISPGELITIFGTNLSNNVHGIAAFSQVPLPASLAGASVLIGGKAIPLFDVVNIGGTEQISAQAPFEIAGQQSVSIAINNGRTQSAAIQVPVAAAQPGIFLPDGVNGAFLHGADNSLVNAASPASAGEVVVLYCTGLGAVTPAGTTGAVASSTTLSNTNLAPTVTVGSTSAAVAFSGLAPALVGLYQINFTVPAGTPSGSANVVVTMNGVTSNVARLPVR
ncbi:MAG: hypothetical protein JST11_18680 [Acidobacteria bacterium]|nr:hypothetical protein [Acidobacteriota bacterium]